MRRLALAALTTLALAAPAQADVADECAPLGSQVQTTACHGVDVVARDAAALTASERAGVREHASTWTHRALAFQQALGDTVPLRDAPWVGTHNSFNSIAEMGPALSTTDANQQLTLVEQLQIDVRSLELDLHWFPSPRSGGMAPVVCHAQEGAGCSVEKPLDEVLAPIGDWLRAHPDEVVLLYLENQLRGEEGSTAAAGIVEEEIGDLVYRPQGADGECVDLPKEPTRDDVLAAGKQVLIVSNCGAGAPWRSWSFGWSDHFESRPRDWSCSDVPADHGDRIVRYFEDDTWLTSAGSNAGAASRDDGLTPETVAAMTRCGVDLTGFDQLTPADGRLAASVWSWAEGEAVDDACAAQRPSDGRWIGDRCRTRRPFVCRAADGTFALSPTPLPGNRRLRGCGAPRTGYENEQARVAAGGRTVWLALPPH